MKKRTLANTAASFAAGAAVVTAVSLPPLGAIGDFAEAHHYPSPYNANPYGSGWTKEFIRSDGTAMIVTLFERDLAAPGLKLEFRNPDNSLPIVFTGRQVGWVPSTGDSLTYALSGAALDSAGLTQWHVVVEGKLLIGEDCFCAFGGQ